MTVSNRIRFQQGRPAPSPSKADGTYAPRSILVTGGAGFIGSNCAHYFMERHPHYKITVIDKLEYCASRNNIASLLPLRNFKFVKGDILSADMIMFLLEEEEVDTIIHFAASTHVDNSFGNSLEFTRNNVLGTHILLEAARVYGRIRRFIHVSTDEVYGETATDAVTGKTERDVLMPTNPYAASKAGAEMLVNAYKISFGLPIIITRSNNVYGPHQYPEKVIPKFTLMASKGKALPIHGDGSQRRSFVFVGDVARAFDVILHKGHDGQTYNISGSKEITVNETADMILGLLGTTKGMSTTNVKDRLFNDCRYFIDDSNLRALGWEPEVDFEEGMDITVKWYLEHGEDWFETDVNSVLVDHPTVQNSFA